MVDIAKHLLNCIEQENGMNDGGPGSGRKPGSKNKNHKMTFTPQEKQGIVSRINAQHPNPNSRLHRQSPKELKERLGTLDIVLKDKNATIKYDKDIRSKSWKDNLNKIDDIVNVTNKAVGDCNIAQELLKALDVEDVQDGGPGSGRKKGSRNLNNVIATFEANGRNSEKAKQNIIQKYAHQPASEKTFNQREQELNRVREKGQSVTHATRNAARHGTRLTPINSVDDGGPGSGNFGHAGRKGHVGGSSKVQGNKKTLVLNEKDKNKIASTLNTITKVLNKNKVSFKDSESWESESEFDKAVADVKDTLNDKDIHIGVNGEYTALNVRITLDDKNATIKYDSKVRGKDWNTEDNKNRLNSIVNVTNKTVEDGIEQSDIPKVAELMLGIFSGETIEDGGPGSGRKPGSKNKNSKMTYDIKRENPRF